MDPALHAALTMTYEDLLRPARKIVLPIVPPVLPAQDMAHGRAVINQPKHPWHAQECEIIAEVSAQSFDTEPPARTFVLQNAQGFELKFHEYEFTRNENGQ